MITGARYVIAVHDLERSTRYYRDVLGFEIHEVGDPGWRFLIRDRCFIMAGECPDALAPRDLGDHSYFAYLEVTDINQLYAAVVERGAEVTKAIRDEPWQMREFGIRTVDGHRIMVGSARPAAPDPGQATDRSAGEVVTDLPALLAGLDPVLHHDVFVYARLPHARALGETRPLATFVEEEGLTVVARETDAVAAGWPVLFRARWITLRVVSSLSAVGLTAAVSAALTAAGISCNVVAAASHDHLFVPVDRAEEALACLRALQREPA